MNSANHTPLVSGTKVYVKIAALDNREVAAYVICDNGPEHVMVKVPDLGDDYGLVTVVGSNCYAV